MEVRGAGRCLALVADTGKGRGRTVSGGPHLGAWTGQPSEGPSFIPLPGACVLKALGCGLENAHRSPLSWDAFSGRGRGTAWEMPAAPSLPL